MTYGTRKCNDTLTRARQLSLVLFGVQITQTVNWLSQETEETSTPNKTC
jgi:hypothetical protein